MSRLFSELDKAYQRILNANSTSELVNGIRQFRSLKCAIELCGETIVTDYSINPCLK
ncbi:MAG: hypothetical protein MJ193_03965 [Clostridia bacterium]|nr:hypothetical protein [Clostridia bacterium]